MHIDQEKLAKAFAALWIFIAIPISQDLYDAAFDGGLLMSIFSLALVGAPVWLVFGWRWLTSRMPIPFKYWGLISVSGVITFIIFANSYNYDEIAYVPLVSAAAFLGMVWIYERGTMIFIVKKTMKTIKNFFVYQPPEVTKTLADIDALERRFFISVLKDMIQYYADRTDIPYDPDFGRKLFDIIRSSISKNKEMTVRKISEQKYHPGIYALMLIVSTTSGALKSGKHHIGSDVLSGNGEMLKALYLFALKELEQSDDYDYKAEEFLEKHEEEFGREPWTL